MRHKYRRMMAVTGLFFSLFPALAQTTDARLDRLAKEMEELKAGQIAIQKELEGLKTLLTSRQTPAFKPVDVTVSDAPSLGAEDAKVTIVEFTDYQCPYCARHSRQTLARINNDYIKTGKVRYVLKDLPLESAHPQAFRAAEAAYCAGGQGKYWEMHDKLFAEQKAMSPEDWIRHADALGLNTDAFKTCLEGAAFADKVRRNLKEAVRVGARGTPASFLGLTEPRGTTIRAVEYLNGAQPYAVFQNTIDKLLAEAAR